MLRLTNDLDMSCGKSNHVGWNSIENFICKNQRLQISLRLFQLGFLEACTLRKDILVAQELIMIVHAISKSVSHRHPTVDELLSYTLFCSMSCLHDAIECAEKDYGTFANLHRQHWHHNVANHLLEQDLAPNHFYGWIKWMYLALLCKLKCMWVIDDIQDTDMWKGFIEMTQAHREPVGNNSSHNGNAACTYSASLLFEGSFWLFCIEYSQLRSLRASEQPIPTQGHFQRTQIFLNGMLERKKDRDEHFGIDIVDHFRNWAARANDRELSRSALQENQGQRKEWLQGNFLLPQTCIFESNELTVNSDTSASSPIHQNSNGMIFISLTTNDTFASIKRKLFPGLPNFG